MIKKQKQILHIIFLKITLTTQYYAEFQLTSLLCDNYQNSVNFFFYFIPILLHLIHIQSSKFGGKISQFDRKVLATWEDSMLHESILTQL